MYHILLKMSHVVASSQSWHFFQTNLFSKPSKNHQPNHQPSFTSQSWGFWGFRHEVFLHVLPKSSAAFAGVWTKAPGAASWLVIFFWSENWMTWMTWSIKSWYLGYGSQAGQSRDWEVHLSSLDKDSKHGSMKRGKFSTLNKHSREHHSEIVAATCILLKTSKTSTKKKMKPLWTLHLFASKQGSETPQCHRRFLFASGYPASSKSMGVASTNNLEKTATLHRSTACIDHACPSTAILNRRGMNPTRIGTH